MIRVFIADDHAVLRDGLSFLLQAQPDLCVIGDAATGHEAVALVKQMKPDVVLMDISMPGLNGIDATALITQAVPETRVIILSMQGTREHIFRALQAGAQGYVLKDSAGKIVAEAVRAVHSGSRYFSDEIMSTLVADYMQQRQDEPAKSPLERLSEREHEILLFVVEGKSSAEIGEILSLSPKTVETYRSRLMQKLGLKDLPSLVKFAVQHGLTTLD
jgi:DNA-binding NarL/FixJ family response regulator